MAAEYNAIVVRRWIYEIVEVLNMPYLPKKSRGLRVLCLLMALALFLPLMPAMAEVTHGVVTRDRVLFRQVIGSSDYWDYLNSGWAVEVLGTEAGGGFSWYKVKTTLPHKPSVTETGYLRSDVMRLMTAQEEQQWLTNPVQGSWQNTVVAVQTTPPTTGTGTGTTGTIYQPGESSLGAQALAEEATTYTSGYVRITQTNTNLRNKPDGGSLKQLAKNLILPYYGLETIQSGYRWIYVLDTQSGQYGYVRSDCYTFVNQDGSAASGPAQQTDAAVVVTPAPIASSGYAVNLVEAANLRQTPGGYSVTLVPQNAVVNLTGRETSGWYPVTYNGYTGYLNSSFLRIMTAAEVAAYLAGQSPGTGTVPAPGGTSDGYVRITAVRVNLRDRPDGASMLQMDKDQIIPYYGAPQYKNGVAWLYVYYTPARVYGYVHGDFYQYTTQSGTVVTQPPAVQTPVPGTSVQVSGYVKLIKDKVNLRLSPGGESQTQLALNAILPYSNAPTYYGGYNWVQVTDPLTRRTGYVRSDCYTFTDESGNPLGPGAVPTATPVVPVVTPVPSGGGTINGTVTLIKGGVNLRTQPGGPSIAQLQRGTVLNYYGFAQQGGYSWYYVLAPQGAGYIRGDMVTVSQQAGVVTPGPVPDAGAIGATGYVITIKSNVNLRKLPGGLTLVQLPKGHVYPITGPIVSKDGYNWYFINSEANTGYLRGDVVRQLTQGEIDNYLNNGVLPSLTAPAGTPSTGATGHVQITENFTNIRVSPSLDAGKLGQVNRDTVLPYRSSLSSGGRMWYQVEYAGQNAYVLGNLARIMTAAEYAAWQSGQPAPTAAPATAAPRPEDYSTTAVTLMDRVLLRSSGSMSASTLTVLYRAGTTAQLLGSTTQSGGYTWYNVRAAGVNGWVRSDMVRILTKAEAGTGTGTGTGTSDKPVATYRTLRKGMTGEDVTRLQNQLILLGLMPGGSANGVYNTQTELAVREYQKVENLFVDGVAGQKTQDALYGTVAPDAPSGGSTVEGTLYPVEIVDWYTGDVQTVWGKGDIATITDVHTGLSFRAKRWSGGYHADVEPLTAADTAVMLKIYGVKSAQEISDKNLYQRRPLWVTLKGRTFAASQYGVPHNYPAGDTIRDNDFNGQFCVHFYNSRTHSSGRVDSDHMKAIQEAYNKAPVKK